MARSRRSRNKTMNKNNKKLQVIIILSIILLVFIMLFSVIFSIINIGNNKIIKGVKIENIDVSNLSQEEATQKLKEYYEELVGSNVKIKYENLEKDIKIEQLKPNIDINNLVQKAISIGKSGNIVKDNYDILFTLIFGKNINNEINLDANEVDKIINEINDNLPNALEQSNYYIEDNNLIITKGKNGIELNREEFKKRLKELINNDLQEFYIPVLDSKPEKVDIEKIYNEIYKEKQDAYISQDPIEIHPEVNGVDLAISIDEAKKILEEEKEEYIIPLNITIPEITLEKLGKEAFPSKLSTFTTRYDASNINRSTNLELASKKIDGTIVLPGETFSYNKIVGERTIEEGYKEAAVYLDGKVVDGIGGGICQLSSTLYNAVVYANLEVTSRSNHRFLTSYVTAGRDATVS